MDGADRPAGPTRDDEQPAQRRLELLYRTSAPALRRRLRANGHSREDASDMLQEAFARLLGSGAIERLRTPEAFLGRILRNLAIDRSRRTAARPPLVALDEDEAPAEPPRQAEAIECEQTRARYRASVAALPGRMREVFLLHRVEELSYKAIAARLQISVRTVEWHMAEAIVRIARGLEDE